MSRNKSYFQKRRVKNKRFLLIIALILVSSFVYFKIYNKNLDKKISELNSLINDENLKKDSLKNSISEIKQDYSNRNTDEFKEKIARNRLDMVKESEVSYEDGNNTENQNDN